MSNEFEASREDHPAQEGTVNSKAREALSALGQELIRQANGDSFHPYHPLAIQKIARSGVADFEQSLDDCNPLKIVAEAGKNLLDLDVHFTETATYYASQYNIDAATYIASKATGQELPNLSIVREPVPAELFTPMWVAEVAGEWRFRGYISRRLRSSLVEASGLIGVCLGTVYSTGSGAPNDA